MKFSEGIQRSLPFGYLFLVVMGILKESVFYYQIGINILKYSTIMDILISPIATLTSHPVILIALIIIIVFSFAFPAYLSKQSNKNKKWAQKMAALKDHENMSKEAVENHFTNMFVRFTAMMLLSFFVGIGWGEGMALTKRIKEKSLKYDYTLNNGDENSEQVYLIGSNSMYYIYLTKGNNTIKIAPIGSIKSIELTHNRKLND
ncbi:hypothetical protein BBH99_03035 [Chryseobacterium contaminans]|uniref:Uncharacterized protein n=1 Tax=Chryseobacterium contaminans TaxID=1423959 RepID=A0A1M7H7G6_9FLAO|nr:hypothetical protein [Chryseobacterium contaminans]OCA72706.1 hypothetical protein BBH99_03035 [Chryseobacterium contaminans]SHM24532.1 hypothetical protein SAMN05444407_111114 [Chryseobacterium contaminans]